MQDLLKSFKISITNKYILKILYYLEDNWRRLQMIDLGKVMQILVGDNLSNIFK